MLKDAKQAGVVLDILDNQTPSNPHKTWLLEALTKKERQDLNPLSSQMNQNSHQVLPQAIYLEIQKLVKTLSGKRKEVKELMQPGRNIQRCLCTQASLLSGHHGILAKQSSFCCRDMKEQ